MRYVRADVPDEIYECRPKTLPHFAEPLPHLGTTTPNSGFVAGLTAEESRRFKAMVLETEACLSAWRSWSR